MGKTKSAVKKTTAVDDGKVEASTLTIGDKIHFPNSRHAQAIEQIVTEDGTVQGTTLRLVAEGGETTWMVLPTQRIRKEAN